MSDSFDSLENRCLARAPISGTGSFADGTVFGDWRVTAFIGRGGNGEVYCAEHVVLGTPAAVKVLTREDERAHARFEREAKLLAQLKSVAFPRFYAFGEGNGTAYLVMELLEPGDLPAGEKAIVHFLLKVCDAVSELHAQGLVHRDIKPSNILWRNTDPVLADLGLVKDISQPHSHPTPQSPNPPTTLSGTLGYGAPEQIERGEVSFAADIHALGVLADRCFGGKPPRVWARIIRRATSSIPEQRYPSVAALAWAIRWRNILPHVVIGVAVGIFASVLATGIVFWWSQGLAEVWKWRMLCRRGEIVSVATSYERIDGGRSHFSRYIEGRTTNHVEGVIIHLPTNTVSFSRPIRLKAGEYRIVGPGRLDAALSGPSNVVLRLKNCLLNNTTDIPYPRNGIKYHLEGGAYLNFVKLQKTEDCKYITSEGRNEFRFQGPLTIVELNEELRRESQNALKRDS